LIDLLADLNVSLSEEQNQQFNKYLQLLLEYNQKFNLTSIVEPKDVKIKHFYDSLLLLTTPYWQGEGSVLDLGTGAGFPGVPLKILFPDVELVLMDAVAKKIGFLNILAAELGLEKVSAVQMRAEDAGRSPLYRESFDFLVTRALAPMPVLAEYCLPLVKVGGYVAAYKGPNWQEEVSAGEKAISLLGGKCLDVCENNLPEEYGSRSIVILQKIKNTPLKYPRKAGMPAKKPLM